MIIKETGEGYIKFICNFEQEKIEIPEEIFLSLNQSRSLLKAKGWIGTYPDGIGFGNLSIRKPGTSQFYITGSATGEIPDLEKKHYALVENCEVEKNRIQCRGMVKASSESMSHHIVYQTLPEINAVVHIHNFALWEKYLDRLPTTGREIAYGTPEMASEIEKILKQQGRKAHSVIVMGGHPEGILSFGRTMEEATQIMLQLEK